MADALAMGPYQNRTIPFPVGATLVKEEYAPSDTSCSGAIQRWTLMQKLPPGSSPQTLDWRWQQIGLDHKVVTQDEVRCINCHADCGKAPDGYAGTCTKL